MSTILNTIYLQALPDGEPLGAQQAPQALLSSKRIELVVGDLVESRADLIIASSSVDIFPHGAVIKSLRRYHGYDEAVYPQDGVKRGRLTADQLSPLKLFPTRQYPHSNLGVWIKNEDLPTGQDLIIVALTPRAGFEAGFKKPLQALIDIIGKIDRQELSVPDTVIDHPQPPYCIALPILGGDRHELPPKERMEVLLKALRELLLSSVHLEQISLYVYEHREAIKWSQLFEDTLERYRDLKQELPFRERCLELKACLLDRIAQLKGVRGLNLPHLKHEVLVPLRTHLLYDPPCIATLSTFGRKSWEAVVHFYARQGQLETKRSGLTGIFDGLRQRFYEDNQATSWASLSLIKELGNAASHVQSAEGSSPLTMIDYPVLFCALEKALGLVDPFKAQNTLPRRALYRLWAQELDEERVRLSACLPQELSLDPLLSLSQKERQERFSFWTDALMRELDPHQQHPYWAKRGGAVIAKIDELRAVLSDVIPRWVSFHLWIWGFHPFKWEQCEDDDWVHLYDNLTRWRLAQQAYDLLINKDHST